MFLIFALLVAYYMTRNTVQDLAWKARGEDPPSFRREQDRIARRAKRRPITGRQEARKFWATAWADAWESAHERQQHWHEKGRQRRQEKWLDEAEDEARYINDRIEPDIPAEDVVHEPWGPCQICGREVPPEQLTTRMNESRTTPAAVTVCPSCAADIDSYYDKDGPAAGGQPPQPAGAPDPNPNRPDGNGQPAEPGRPTPSTGATVVDMHNWRTPATTQEENPMAETTNLAAALTYTDDARKSATDCAAGVEQSIASLQTGGVTGRTITSLQHAHEAAIVLAGAFADAHTALEEHIAVKEAYNATDGAGDREFVTQE